MSDLPENPEAIRESELGPLAEKIVILPAELAAPAVPAPPPDPVWGGWDLLGLLAVTIVTLMGSFLGVLLVARRWLYPHLEISELGRNALIVVTGEALGYLFVFGYMYLLVTRQRTRPKFFPSVHWNWPLHPGLYMLVGAGLSVSLQLLAHLLPIPKNLPIDSLFRTPAEAWALTLFGVTLAPLMEELLFRGFLYPVLNRHLGVNAAVLLTALGFALLHGSQLKFSWGPLLVIFLVGLVLTIVRGKVTVNR